MHAFRNILLLPPRLAAQPFNVGIFLCVRIAAAAPDRAPQLSMHDQQAAATYVAFGCRRGQVDMYRCQLCSVDIMLPPTDV